MAKPKKSKKLCKKVYLGIYTKNRARSYLNPSILVQAKKLSNFRSKVTHAVCKSDTFEKDFFCIFWPVVPFWLLLFNESQEDSIPINKIYIFSLHNVNTKLHDSFFCDKLVIWSQPKRKRVDEHAVIFPIDVHINAKKHFVKLILEIT